MNIDGSNNIPTSMQSMAALIIFVSRDKNDNRRNAFMAAPFLSFCTNDFSFSEKGSLRLRFRLLMSSCKRSAEFMALQTHLPSISPYLFSKSFTIIVEVFFMSNSFVKFNCLPFSIYDTPA